MYRKLIKAEGDNNNSARETVTNSLPRANNVDGNSSPRVKKEEVPAKNIPPARTPLENWQKTSHEHTGDKKKEMQRGVGGNMV